MPLPGSLMQRRSFGWDIEVLLQLSVGPAMHKSWLRFTTALNFSGVCRLDTGNACVGFCAPSLGSAAIQVVLKLSANYGRATSSLQTEVSATRFR